MKIINIFFKNYNRLFNHSLIHSLLLLLLSIFMVTINNEIKIQNYIGYGLLIIGMITVGIPHGSTDYLEKKGKQNFKELSKFIIGYILISLLMGIIWFISFKIALIIFLIYSGWHFGQNDGIDWNLNKYISFFWGIYLLTFILASHTNETNQILSTFLNFKFNIDLPFWTLFPWLIFALFKKQYSFALTVIWLTITSSLPLIFSFGLYFVGHHSINSWNQIQKKLNISKVKIWIYSSPFHLTSWLFFILYFAFIPTIKLNNIVNYWGFFFIFLSCISLPHSLKNIFNK